MQHSLCCVFSCSSIPTLSCMQVEALKLLIGDGVITHGQRVSNRPPPGGGGYELWVKGPNLGIMAKVIYESWI